MTEIIQPFSGLEIVLVDLICEDGRGQVWEADINQSPRITLFHRFAESLTGGHYHLPGHPTRDPEFTLLITGLATIYCRNIITFEDYMGQFRGPVLFKYATNVYHAMRADTDIWFTDLHDNNLGREFNVIVPELHDILNRRKQ